MTDDTSNGLVKSMGFHVLIVVIMLLLAYTVNTRPTNAPAIFELVAGEGNDYAAKVAPALGDSGSVKLTVPMPPVPKAEPAPPEPAPIPAPPPPVQKPIPKAAPTVPTVPPETKVPDFASKLRRQVIVAESKAKQQIARDRAAEAKRLAKEEADRAKQAKLTPKYTPIDGAGIRQGVLNGSTENTKGGANGKALTAEEGAALDRYFSLLKRRLQEALDRPTGLSDTLVATVEFRIAASGTLSAARIKKSSGSPEFDRAVLEAINRVSSIGPRPDGKSEAIELDFKMKEQDGV